ncbi:MAG: hypothetical protein J6B64_03805 [Bacilli bacterium]|nr:hypothetical protein [Bacilli bacterium]
MSLNNIGISYSGSYLLQGNQIERLKKSLELKANTTELLLRTDKKECDIDSLRKVYNGNILFHVPAINPDLANLKIVNEIVRNLKENKIELITINASNLSLDLFEWSTLDEQKKYFLNIVTAISTLASNKIEVAVDNIKYEENNNLFGSNIAQMTDIIVYSRKMLVRDFGFREEEAEKYIGLSLNIDNIRTDSSKESLENWMEVFSNSIKCIKISNPNDTDKINKMLDIMEKDNKDYTILLSTNSDLDEINSGYINLINLIDKDSSIEIEEKNTVTDIKSDKKMTNYIILGMIIATIVIICMMFVLKLR